MPALNENQMTEIANTVRVLSAEAVQKANSGHPGLPLGCAEIGAVLYGSFLNYNPEDPQWINRDRLVLSAGHGSMWLYSLLHLSGHKLSLDEIKNFRQLHSQTPGHPEFGDTEGVECTTGPLGQGVAMAVGMAMAAQHWAALFNTEDHAVIDHLVIALCGDGCMMEGVTAEAVSLAGHMKLNNLVLLYDANRISLDGPLEWSMSEDVPARFKSLGWNVESVDGHNCHQLSDALERARAHGDGPTLIVTHTMIGRGAPNKQGTSACHGAPLGEDEIKALKEGIGWSDEAFHVPESVRQFFSGHQKQLQARYDAWQNLFAEWKMTNPARMMLWKNLMSGTISDDLEASLPRYEIGKEVATRSASHQCIQSLAQALPQFLGGAADLACSNKTDIDGEEKFGIADFKSRNVYFGVREFAMAAASNGIALYGGLKPFCATFLAFSDYMRGAIRLSALMKTDVTYVFTHDSFWVGEDGPTHQPVEHLAALRAIPGLTVIRPADAHETRAAWTWAMTESGPCALVLSRQNLKILAESDRPCGETVGRGAYVVLEPKEGSIDHLIFATGSEVALAQEAGQQLQAQGLNVKVVSVPSFEIFDQQDQAYRDSILEGDIKQRWAIEAQVDFGWHRYIGRDGHTITMAGFGACGPGKEVAAHFGFTVDQVVAKISAQQAVAP